MNPKKLFSQVLGKSIYKAEPEENKKVVNY